jgi:hypothetical protein
MHAGIKSLLLLLGLLLSEGIAQADPRHVHSFLPSSRSTFDDSTVTVFLAVANAGDTDLEKCAIAQEPHGSIIPTPEIREVVEIDSGGRIIDGTRFQSFSLAIGQTRQYLIGLGASAGHFNNEFFGTENAVNYENRVRILCLDAISGAPVETTRNDASHFVFRAFNDREPPDLIPIIATPSADGVIRINPESGRGVASVAAINIGAAGDFRFHAEPSALVNVRACRSDVSGICLNNRSDEFSFHLDRNETAFFSIVVDDHTDGRTPFAPDIARLAVRIDEITDDGLGAIASTSVAIVDDGPPLTIEQLAGQWRFGSQINDFALTLFPDGSYVLGTVGVFEKSANAEVYQTGLYETVEVSDGFSITGTAGYNLSGRASAGFTGTIRSDGLMRITRSDALNQFRGIQIDNQLPLQVVGTFASTSLYSRQSLPLDASLPHIVIAQDGRISGRFLEDLNLFENHGITCGVEGTLRDTVELTQCNAGGTYTAQIFLLEDSRDSQRATLAFLRLENDRGSYSVYLFNTDLN